MPDRSFNEDLSLLKSGNFLGGLAKYGQAVKEGRQHESLVETYNKFKAEKEGLLTTQEQIEGTNKRTSLIDLPADVPPDIRATVDMFSYLDRIDKLQQTYQPYIDVFYAMGTEESIGLGEALTKDLAQRTGLEEQRGQIPFQELKWLNRELEYNMNMAQYQELLGNIEQKKEVQSIANYMMTLPAFDPDSQNKLPTGKNAFHSIQERNRIAQLENNILRSAESQFPKVQFKDSVLKALNWVKDLTGREYSYKELTPQQLQGRQVPELAYGGMLTTLQAWSEKWRGFTPEYIKDLQAFMREGIEPEKVLGVEGTSIDKYNMDEFKKNAEVYGSAVRDGYMDYWTVLKSSGSPFKDMMIMKEIVLLDGRRVQVPDNPLYKSLIYPARLGVNGIFNSFIEGNFDYLPGWTDLTIAEQNKVLNNLGNNTIPVGDIPEDINIFGEGGTIDRSIHEILTGRKLPTVKKIQGKVLRSKTVTGKELREKEDIF